MSSYFVPTITIDDANMRDYSKLVGLVPVILIPAEVNRIGMTFQNLSETNDLWWGYDDQVGINKPGYFCLTATPAKKEPHTSPANGTYRGVIYAISDGGSKVTAKTWLQF